MGERGHLQLRVPTGGASFRLTTTANRQVTTQLFTDGLSGREMGWPWAGSGQVVVSTSAGGALLRVHVPHGQVTVCPGS